MLFLIGVYISDVTRTRLAIRSHHPVIAHFRYYFGHLGTLFRQIIFTVTSNFLADSYPDITAETWISP
jgi:hypothetical protein